VESSFAQTTYLMKTKLLMFTALAVTLTSASGAAAQLPPEARAGLWKAQWITSPSAPQRDIVVLHFRKAIEIPRVPEHFVVHVSADSQFILSVNQREVGRGPARSDLAHWKYETYDLAALLRPGRNDIAATVWSLGVSTGAQISDRTAFVLRGDSTEASVADTNTTWEVEEDKGVQVLPTPPDIQRSYYVAEPADQIDGALFDWSWNDAASSRGKWEKAAPIGNASERGVVLQNNNWQLMPNLLPAMQMEPTPVGRVVRASN
jgi:alpha-L-rhamnosidase